MLNFLTQKTNWKPDKDIPKNKDFINKTLHWHFQDSIDNYRVSGNKSYNQTEITYKFNSYGYRSCEFNISDPKLISIGCSTVFGTGLPKHEMFSEQVANHLGVKNCNLAFPGMSNDYISRILYVAVPIINPDFVLVQFAAPSRREYWTHSGNLLHYFVQMCGYGETKFASGMLRELGNINDDLNNLYKNFCFISKILEGRKWAFSCLDYPYFQDHLQGFYDKSRFAGMMYFRDSHARDGVHPGKETNLDLALTYNKIFDSMR